MNYVVDAAVTVTKGFQEIPKVSNSEAMPDGEDLNNPQLFIGNSTTISPAEIGILVAAGIVTICLAIGAVFVCRCLLVRPAQISQQRDNSGESSDVGLDGGSGDEKLESDETGGKETTNEHSPLKDDLAEITHARLREKKFVSVSFSSASDMSQTELVPESQEFKHANSNSKTSTCIIS